MELANITSLFIQNWVVILAGSLCFIPFYFLIKYYRRTELTDYLLFALVYFFAIITFYTTFVRDVSPPTVLLSQICDTAYNIFTLLLFFYVVRVKWYRIPPILLLIGLFWFSTIQFLILFYEIVTLPETGFSLFAVMRRAPPGKDIGVAVITNNGIILLGRGYFLLADGFFLCVMSLAAYIYFTMKPVVKDSRIKRAQYLWVISAVFANVRPILLLGHLFFLWTSLYIINIVFNLCTAITIAYVTLLYPESVVLSYAQIVRASNLYQRIHTFSSDSQVREFGMAPLVDYIQKIPGEILTVLVKETEDLS